MAEEKRIITYSEAIREAMCEEMRRDENVFLMGRTSAFTAAASA